MVKYTRKNSVFNLGYHLVFCPKYRKPFLMKFENMIKKSFHLSSIKMQFMIEEIDIMPDHVHIFIKCTSINTNLAKIVQHLKGFSSYTIRKRFSTMKRYKAFWSPSFFAESIGNMSEKTIRKYIKNQKVNVKSNYRYKNIIKRLNILKSNHYDKEKNTSDAEKRSEKAVLCQSTTSNTAQQKDPCDLQQCIILLEKLDEST